MKNYTLFNRLILFTVEAYIARAIEDGTTHEDFHKKLVGGIRSFMVMGRFSKKESERLQKLGEDPIMEKIKNQEISFVVYALELMRLWVTEVPREVRKNIYLGVSNKKLLLGRAYFVKTMLHLKHTDEESYKEKRQIIDESVLNAKHFFSFFEEKLTCKPIHTLGLQESS